MTEMFMESRFKSKDCLGRVSLCGVLHKSAAVHHLKFHICALQIPENILMSSQGFKGEIKKLWTGQYMQSRRYWWRFSLSPYFEAYF